MTAVVGTIILVAIVIGIVTGVFLAWKLLMEEQADSAPSVGFTVDEEVDRLVVSTAVQDADWNMIQLSAVDNGGFATTIHVGTAEPYMNEDASATGGDLLAGRVQLATSSHPVSAPDYVEFCADSTTTQVRVSVFDSEANTRLGTWHFNDIAAC